MRNGIKRRFKELLQKKLLGDITPPVIFLSIYSYKAQLENCDCEEEMKKLKDELETQNKKRKNHLYKNPNQRN